MIAECQREERRRSYGASEHHSQISVSNTPSTNRSHKHPLDMVPMGASTRSNPAKKISRQIAQRVEEGRHIHVPPASNRNYRETLLPHQSSHCKAIVLQDSHEVEQSQVIWYGENSALHEQDPYQFEWYRLLVTMTSILFVLNLSVFLKMTSSIQFEDLLIFLQSLKWIVLATLIWTASGLCSQRFHVGDFQHSMRRRAPSYRNINTLLRTLCYLWFLIIVGVAILLTLATLFIPQTLLLPHPLEVG